MRAPARPSFPFIEVAEEGEVSLTRRHLDFLATPRAGGGGGSSSWRCHAPSWARLPRCSLERTARRSTPWVGGAEEEARARARAPEAGNAPPPISLHPHPADCQSTLSALGYDGEGKEGLPPGWVAERRERGS